MRRVILAVAALATLNTASAACNIELVKKKNLTAQAFIGTTSVSSKLQEAFRQSGCTIDYRIMTAKERLDFEDQKYQARRANLKAKLSK